MDNKLHEIKIKIDTKTKEKLKKLAQEEYRSLANYITVKLINIADNKVMDLSAIPANTTIRTTTPASTTATPEPTLTPYRKLQTRAKELLGRYLLYDEWCLLDFRNFDHEYYDKKYETPTEEGAAIKCTYIYNLPEERQEEYLKDIKQYDSHHPFNPHDYDEYDYEPKTWADRIVFPHDNNNNNN